MATDARKAAERRPLCVILANSVWDVLVKCGATEERGREDFVVSQGHRFQSEYSFMGYLGFGGKFYRDASDNEWRVGCYREHDTPERLAIIERTNAALAELRERALKRSESNSNEAKSKKMHAPGRL